MSTLHLGCFQLCDRLLTLKGQILILADESLEDSIVHSDSRSLATLLLIRDIQVTLYSFTTKSKKYIRSWPCCQCFLSLNMKLSRECYWCFQRHEIYFHFQIWSCILIIMLHSCQLLWTGSFWCIISYNVSVKFGNKIFFLYAWLRIVIASFSMECSQSVFQTRIQVQLLWGCQDFLTVLG